MRAATVKVDVAGILKRLGIDSINAGAWSGSLGWSKDIAGSRITSVNPATGETLAEVRGATITDYEAVMRSAVEAAAAWRKGAAFGIFMNAGQMCWNRWASSISSNARPAEPPRSSL